MTVEATETLTIDPAADAASDAMPSLDDILADFPEDAPEAPETQEAAPAAPEPPKPAPEPEAPRESVAARFNALAEKERALQRQREEIAAKESEYAPLKKLEEAKKLLEKDALAGLEALGVDFDTLTKAALSGNGTKPTAEVERVVEERLRAIEEKFEQRTKQLEEAHFSALREKAMAEVRENVTKGSAVLAGLGELGTNAVVEKIQEHYQRTGRAPSYSAVIKETEEEVVAFLKSVGQNEALRKIILGENQVVSSKSPQRAKPSKTLSNQAGATPTARTTDINIDELPRDKAIDAILGQ